MNQFVAIPTSPALPALVAAAGERAGMRFLEFFTAAGREGEGETETHLWTWGGTYFGYRDSDALWTHDGYLVGQFHGAEVYGSDGAYLGEIEDSDRLITKISKHSYRRGSFTVRQRGARGVRGAHGSRGMRGGYEDFPDPDNLV
jgi:hypothetical protein